MAYIVVKGKKNPDGTSYVSLVEKGRVNGVVRTIRHITGLGSMNDTEFEAFKKWAHGMKDQEYRKQAVTTCPIAVAEQKKGKERMRVHISEKKEKEEKRAKRVLKKEKRAKKTVKRDKPEPEKEKKTHTETMMQKEERKKQTYTIKELTKVQKYEAEIINIKVEMNKIKKQLAKTKGLKERTQLEKVNREQMLMIKERHGKIKDILGEKYRSGREVAKAHEKGKVHII